MQIINSNYRNSICSFFELGHQTSSSGLSNSIFGNAPFSQVPQTSTGVSQKFPAPQQQQQQQHANMFPTQPFPPTSNPFVQQPFRPSKINNK